MKKMVCICAAGILTLTMAAGVPVYADRSGKTELPQDSTDYYMTVDSGGVGVDIYPETSDKSEKLNDKTVEDGTVLHIEGETEKNGENWGYTEYNGTHGYVPLDELRPSKEEEIAAEKDDSASEKDSTVNRKENTTDGENTTESEKSEELLETEDQSVVKMSPVPTEIEESVKTKPVNGTATASFKEEESWYQNPFLWIGCAAILAVIGILVYHFKKRG